MGQAGVAFRSLLAARPGEGPGDTQRRAGRELPAWVAGSHLRWWSPGDPIPAAGRRLLIGVAVWSGYDLRLLDLADAAAGGNPDGPVVDVFDLDAAGPGGDFEPYVPGIGDVCNSPVVGLWLGGRLVNSGTGHDARLLAADVLGFDMAELTARPTHAVAS